jgi:hypothetical protein
MVILNSNTNINRKWINLVIYMKMLREDRKDKIKFIALAWKLNVHSNLILNKLNTIILD